MTDTEIIARHYGLEEQALQCIEEMAELTQAINKVRRHYSNDNIEHMIEEMADVQVMLNQLIYLTDSRAKVSSIMAQKIQRQLERIGMPKKEGLDE